MPGTTPKKIAEEEPRPLVRDSRRLRSKVNWIFAVAIVGLCAACTAIARAPHGDTGCLRAWQLVATHPHDPSHFTQGLLLTDGRLFESTGLYGVSAVQEVELRTGRRLRRQPLPRSDFGEGLARVGDRLVQLTWREGRAWIFDLSLRPLGTLPLQGEGWGLTTARIGQQTWLLQSDGSDRLHWLDPQTLQRVRSVAVRDGRRPVRLINELEFVEGEVLANLWHRDEVVAIDPTSGAVRGRYDFGVLRQQLAWPNGEPPETDMNGVAYDDRSGHVLLTGKRWPWLFEVRLQDCVAEPDR